MRKNRIQTVLIVVATVAAGSPVSARAVAITQVPLPGPAEGIGTSSGGVLLTGVPNGSSVTRVTGTPQLVISPGAIGPGAEYDITTGPDGNTWFIGSVMGTEEGHLVGYAALFEVMPTGVVLRVRYPRPLEAMSPEKLATGPDHALWTADVTAGAIERYEPGGTFTVYKLPEPNGIPVGIVPGPENAMWFTDAQGRIGRITTTGEITERRIEDGDWAYSFGLMQPYGIVEGPDHALWFAEQNAGRIGRMTPGGELSEFAIPNPLGVPAGSSLKPKPRWMAVGPEGAIWFTDPGDDAVGQVTMNGMVTEYPAPGAPITDVVPNYIVSGPEGKLYFTEEGTSELGVVDPNGTPVQTQPRPATKGRVAYKRLCKLQHTPRQAHARRVASRPRRSCRFVR